MIGETPPGDPGDLGAAGVIVLPEMVYDGVEAARAEILRPHAAQYLEEIEVAAAKEIDEEDQRPRVSDFDSVDAFVEWHLANLTPTQQVDADWNQRLGIVPQNNLYIIFGSNCLLDTEIIRRYVGLLREEDPQFVDASRVSSDAAGRAMQKEVDAWRTGEELPREESVDGQVARWISDLYMTEAAERLKRLGASPAAMKSLRN